MKRHLGQRSGMRVKRTAAHRWDVLELDANVQRLWMVVGSHTWTETGPRSLRPQASSGASRTADKEQLEQEGEDSFDVVRLAWPTVYAAPQHHRRRTSRSRAHVPPQASAGVQDADADMSSGARPARAANAKASPASRTQTTASAAAPRRRSTTSSSSRRSDQYANERT